MIDNKNKKLVSRIVFLVVFGLLMLSIFLIDRGFSKGGGSSVYDLTYNSEPGKATLVEYSDFQCPACRMYYPLVKQLRVDFGDKLIFVYKYFPLKSIHKNADLSARAGEAARLQGKFDEMENILFTKQNEWAGSDQAQSLFVAYALSLGFNREKFLEDIDSSSVKGKVDGDYQEGTRLRVAGTPTFFLNGKKLNNPTSYDEFKKLIQDSIEQ